MYLESKSKQVFEEEFEDSRMVMELWRNHSKSKSSEKSLRATVMYTRTPLEAVSKSL